MTLATLRVSVRLAPLSLLPFARWWLPFSVFVVGVTAAETISGEEPTRPPLPEQILTESITDLDAIEPGETEFALNA